MASIKERNGKYCVIYNYVNPKGKRKQKWETYTTKAEAKARKAEIEYKETNGTFIVPQCTCLKELLTEYVNLYGKDKWALSTYSRNCSLIENYIEPLIGDLKLSQINTRVLEVYYQKLLDTPAVPTQTPRKTENGMVGLSTIRDIHKLLRSCFEQAAKWELLERNPAVRATVPKYKPKKREIWTADILMHANEVCEDEELKLAMNLAFSGSLRIGELIGLTWDCVDISPEAVEEGRAYIYINKEYQRVSKNAIRQLNGKDILVTFPSKSKLCSTVRVLKTPKTESSIRKIYIPRTVSEMLARQKAEQDKIKEMLGSEYQDYGLVMATGYGMPMGTGSIHKKFAKLIEENNLPEVVFHSLRHTSVTYKLKLNRGDIKSVQVHVIGYGDLSVLIAGIAVAVDGHEFIIVLAKEFLSALFKGTAVSHLIKGRYSVVCLAYMHDSRMISARNAFKHIAIDVVVLYPEISEYDYFIFRCIVHVEDLYCRDADLSFRVLRSYDFSHVLIARSFNRIIAGITVGRAVDVINYILAVGKIFTSAASA